MSAPADFFQAGGALSDDAASYIERSADRELLSALERGELCLVLAPRQTGKTSLMVHALTRLNKKSIRAGRADLAPLGIQTDPTRWFSDVLYQIERSLKLKTDSGEWWAAHDRLGPTQRFMSFLEDVVLTEIKDNVVLFLDEIDSVLVLPFSDDFFTTIRSVYNARATNPPLRRLTFVLLGLATASSFIRNPSRTPFNIGTSIALDDFDRGSTAPFRQVLGPESASLIERIFYWTNGQPYLVQKLAKTAFSWPQGQRSAHHIDEEVRRFYLQRQITQDDHLNFIQNYLLDDTANVRKTLRTYRQVLQGKNVVENEQSSVQSRLKLAGVVRGENKRLIPRNRIYENVFNVSWVREHTPRDVQKFMAYSAYVTLPLALLLLGAVYFFALSSPLTKARDAMRVARYDLALDALNDVPAWLHNWPKLAALRVKAGLGARMYESPQDWKSIGQDLRRQRADRPTDADLMVLEAQFWLGQENYDKARALVEAALREDKHNAEAWFLLGLDRDLSGDTAAAVNHYRKAVEAAPASPVYRNNLARGLLELGRFDDALQEYRKISQFPLARVEQALAHWAQGEMREAAKAARDALKMLDDAGLSSRFDNRRAWLFRLPNKGIRLSFPEDKRCYALLGEAASQRLAGEAAVAFPPLECTDPPLEIRELLADDLCQFVDRPQPALRAAARRLRQALAMPEDCTGSIRNTTPPGGASKTSL
jgi:tetratricopeptide (TPR) repeat protein